MTMDFLMGYEETESEVLTNFMTGEEVEIIEEQDGTITAWIDGELVKAYENRTMDEVVTIWNRNGWMF